MSEKRVFKERHASIRRDLNDLIRDPQGKVSAGKVGGILGQWLAIKLTLEHSAALVDKPETLAILLLMLIAPEVVKKFLTMKYGATK